MFAPMDGNRQPLDQPVFQQMPLKTQKKVDVRGDNDEYPPDSINGQVEATLRSFAVSIQMFEKQEFKK